MFQIVEKKGVEISIRRQLALHPVLLDLKHYFEYGCVQDCKLTH
ncbi:MAG: hypothetical protein ABUK19_08435 [Desulfobacteria bacterium]